MNISKYNLNRFSTVNRQSILIPSGDYTAVLENSTYSILKNKNELLKLIWQISNGNYEGEYFFSYFNMGNTESLNVLYKMILNMGFNPEKVKYISELYGSNCRLIIKSFNHIIHRKINIVERYLPVSENSPEIPFSYLFQNTPNMLSLS
jgi:hypothetical protein